MKYVLNIFLLAGFIISSCSTIKISKVEKRRYNDGYYVNISKNKRIKRPSILNKEDLASGTSIEEKTTEIQNIPSGSNKKNKRKNQRNIKKVKVSNKEKITSKPKLGFNSSGPLNFHKRKDINFSQKTLKPSGEHGNNYLTTGLIIAGIIFIVFMIIGLDILLTLLVALLFAVVIVFLLKELEIISQ
ncbi:MAG TPA: hypothetical protein EYN89_09735 [Flavobacteriales bacterium]|nr:hypothetical protein [Flavobacteriales bacterium]